MTDKPVLEKTFNEDLDVEKKIREGGILSRLFMEVQGNDRKTAEEALNVLVFERLMNEPTIYVLWIKMYDLQKEEGQDYYSGVVEIKLLAEDFRWFVSMVMRYGPTAIEIMEPDEVHLSSDLMHSLVADVSEITQVYTSKILSMLRDEERVGLLNKMLAKK